MAVDAPLPCFSFIIAPFCCGPAIRRTGRGCRFVLVTDNRSYLPSARRSEAWSNRGLVKRIHRPLNLSLNIRSAERKQSYLRKGGLLFVQHCVILKRCVEIKEEDAFSKLTAMESPKTLKLSKRQILLLMDSVLLFSHIPGSVFCVSSMLDSKGLHRFVVVFFQFFYVAYMELNYMWDPPD